VSDSFATTRWTLVLAAGTDQTGDTGPASRALAELCRAYWPPLYAHARRRGLPPVDAEDSVQGFFDRLLRLESLSTARRERGRFRSWLLGCFNHYLADLHDHDRAQKRGARLQASLDTEAHEAAFASAASPHLSPDHAFDRAWALALLATVTTRLRDEYQGAGRASHFEMLSPALAGRDADTPHSAIAQKLGLSEPAVRVALHRMRQRYRQLLRDEVSQTVATPGDIDAEIRHLLAALAMHG